MYKKFLIFGIFVFILIYIFIIVNTKNNVTVSTMCIPITSKKIIIDAGHGSPDEGAQNENGVTEAKINLQIAKKLENLLKSGASDVIMTRSGDNAIYNENATTISEKKISDLKNRVKIGNTSSADIFVSIHLNKTNSNKYYGWQTFYKEGDVNSKQLATCIQNNLNSVIEIENKRTPLKLNNIYLMKNIQIPIVIVECGFLSNESEAAKLVTDSYQNKLAWGIYNGIVDYFS